MELQCFGCQGGAKMKASNKKTPNLKKGPSKKSLTESDSGLTRSLDSFQNETPRSCPGENEVNVDIPDMVHMHREPNGSSPKFYNHDLFFSVLALALYIVDIVTDMLLIKEYYCESKFSEMWISIGFVFFPSLITGIVSLIWAFVDSKDGHENQANKEHKCKSACRIVFTFLQCGRIFRTFEFIFLVCKIRKMKDKDEERKKIYAMQAIKHKRDAAILGLLDAFLESALQLILQLYLSIHDRLDMDALRVLQHMSSWGAAAVTVTSYYKTMRRADRNVPSVKYFPSFFYLFGRLCELGPRFLLFALGLVYIQPWYIWLIGGLCHSIFSFSLMVSAKPKLENVCLKCPLFNHCIIFLFCLVHMFCYVHIEDTKTFRRSLLYYVIFYSENFLIAGIIIYKIFIEQLQDSWPFLAFAIFPGSVAHIGLTLLYYKCLHPSTKDTWCKNLKCLNCFF